MVRTVGRFHSALFHGILMDVCMICFALAFCACFYALR